MQAEVYERMAAQEDTHWWFVGRRRILSTVLSRLPLTQDARILEVGCGTGGNLTMLKQFGDVYAIEPDATARDYAQKKTGIVVRDGHLPYSIPFEPVWFDLVVALDVIEHVLNDRAGVESIQKSLKPGGWAVFTVPALSLLWSQHDEVHHHKRRYTKSELTQITKESGFAHVSSTYFNTILFPAIAAVRTIKNLFKIDSIDDAMPPGCNQQTLRNPVLEQEASCRAPSAAGRCLCSAGGAEISLSHPSMLKSSSEDDYSAPLHTGIALSEMELLR